VKDAGALPAREEHKVRSQEMRDKNFPANRGTRKKESQKFSFSLLAIKFAKKYKKSISAGSIKRKAHKKSIFTTENSTIQMSHLKQREIGLDQSS
jgi:hypothetical protein